MKARWVLSRFNSSLCSSSSSPVYTSMREKFQTSQTLPREDSNPSFNHVDISLLLSICGRERDIRLGSSLHASIVKYSEHFDPRYQPNSRNILVVWNSLVSMYAKCGKLSTAAKVFDQMTMRDTVSWNSLISGFLRIKEFEIGFGFFKRMHDSGTCRFDQATLTSILSACDKPEMLYLCKMMHSLVFINDFESEASVGNSLITSYFKCGCSISGRRVFNEMFECNVITWTAVISGLAQNQYFEESLNLFSEMRRGLVDPNSLTYSSSLLACSGLRALREGCQIHGLILKSGLESDLCIESSLMDMYSKCGLMEYACRIFDSAKELDEISMTVILVGFAQNGSEDEALQIFMKMVKAGIEVDANMLSAVLGVFGTETTLSLGKQIHALVVKKNFGSNLFVSNGLINMYSKCGDLGDSIKVFSLMSQRNLVSWNSMIAAFARHGWGFEALKFYEQMRKEGVEPTDVTFLSLLHACSHIGSVQKGMEFFESMSRIHKINPRMEHYACAVDMLGRAGNLNEAKNFIEGLPVRPSFLVWQALLGACSIHGDSIIGKFAADHLMLEAPESATPYVLMANIYSSEGKWEERAKVIKRMKEVGVKKETGLSWIEIDKEVHSFVVEDRTHPQAEVIYEILEALIQQMKDEGYVPNKRYLQYDLYQNGRMSC